jgi:hypothetical protein
LLHRSQSKNLALAARIQAAIRFKSGRKIMCEANRRTMARKDEA